MKTFIVILVIFATVNADEITAEKKDKVKAFVRECKQQTGVDEALVRKLIDGEFEDNANLKEFLSCLFTKAGTQDKDGNMVEDQIKKIWPKGLTESELNSLENNCLTIRGSSPADTAYQFYKCYRQTSPINYAEDAFGN